MAGEIRDAIHRNIALSGLEFALLDTSEVQRLRRIKQLGFTYLVYPSATHTRFEHSLGVMHIAGRVAQALGLDKESVELLRVCGLLHDVGHAPFSHTAEWIVEKFTQKPHEQVSEEIISRSAISDILSDNGIEKSDVADLLGGRLKPASDILSSDLDADRMDYLMRDSHYTGVAYGVVDLERMISTLKLHNNQLVLAGGTQAAESLLRARFLMYPSVYEHHTARIAEGMFSHAVERLLEDKIISAGDLSRLDDVDLVSILRGSKGYAKEMMDRIDSRRLFKRALVLGRTELGKPSVQKLVGLKQDYKVVERVEREIAEGAGLEHGQVLLDILDPLYANGVDLKILKDRKLYNASEISTSIRTLQEAQWDYWFAYVFAPADSVEAVKKSALDVLGVEVKRTDQKRLV